MLTPPRVARPVAGSDPLNTPHTVTIGAPLLRPGMTISATCSERYVPEVTKRLMAIAREINAPTAEQ